MGPGAEAEVGLRVPVDQVVAALAAGLRPVRDLVLLVAGAREAGARPFVLVGGDVRVGLEDNFYLPSDEMAHSNGALCEAAADLARRAGRSLATVDEVRALLWPAGQAGASAPA